MKRILLVEDDLSLINGLAFAVKKQGYLLDAAHTCMEYGQHFDERVCKNQAFLLLRSELYFCWFSACVLYRYTAAL